MDASKAFGAGVAGGAVMSLLMWMARTFMGMPMNLEMMEGTLLVRPVGAVAWTVGFVMHLVISGLIGLIYAWAFAHVTQRAGVGLGALFGLVHGAIGGLVMGLLPAMHPLIPGILPAPGVFLSNIPGGVLALFVLHAIYGAVVGATYKPVAVEHRATVLAT